MSEVLAQLEKKGGGDLKETILWTNPSPTSSFGGVDVSLSETIENFKYVKLYFRISTSNSTQSATIYEKDIFKAFTSAGNGASGAISARQSNTNYFRRVAYKSPTEITYLNTVTASGGYDGNYLIPLKFCGLK